MRSLVLGALLSFAGLQAQDISGNWQGTLGEGNDKIRMVLRIEGRYNARTARLFSIDQVWTGEPASRSLRPTFRAPPSTSKWMRLINATSEPSKEP